MGEKQELTWREAEDLMFGGSEVECKAPGASVWVRQRMVDGDLCVRVVNTQNWVDDDASYHELTLSEWRRVPKTPSLGELAAKWRSKAGRCQEIECEMLSECAAELDAVLREGDYVSLKGVTAEELTHVYITANGFAGILNYLRSRGAK